jgi:hypothetical protein
MTGNVFFDEDVGQHGDNPERAHFGQVIHHGCGALRGVSAAQGGGDGPRIQDRNIKQLAPGMFM